MSSSAQFSDQNYINVETFRKNGQGMRTPVWFVQVGEKLYVRTIAESGKVKRIRNNSHVNVAPCQVDGTLLGEWTPAQAVEKLDAETARHVDRLLDRKYGLQKKFFALLSRFQGQKYTVLEITLKR